MKNIALIGVGPHAKRIYINYFKKYKMNLALVVEINSFANKTREYLNNNGFESTKIFTIDDKYKDNEHLPSDIEKDLTNLCDKYKINYIVISTEPKAHFMYLEFALKHNINVITDKPISAVKDMTSLKSIEKLRKQYYYLLDLANHSTASCKVMCQRQYHRGYEKIKDELAKVVKEYKVPITNIDIKYSDGAWEMPHDMDKENHPFKYGYGELFHSGYHFIDLLSDFLKINNSLGGNKEITSGEVYSQVFTPNDEMQVINIDDYKRLFKNQEIPEYYSKNNNPSFDKFGEKDYHGLFTFYNRNGFTITSASLNLMHDGVSRRSWIKTRDFYKSNGRIRHERIDITIGHLMNIQVHSYQSKEIKDRTDNEEGVGGLEHFDILFFKNPLVDKEPFKEIHLGDLYSKKEKKDFLGYNELAREEFLNNFFNDKDCKGDIRDQALSIELLYACAKGTHNHYAGIDRPEKINIRNEYTYRYNASKLKVYSDLSGKNKDKKEIYYHIYYKDDYVIYSFINYLKKDKLYEVFISIADPQDVAGCLLRKTFKNKIQANLYFLHLENIIKNKSMFYLENYIKSRLRRH